MFVIPTSVHVQDFFGGGKGNLSDLNDVPIVVLPDATGILSFKPNAPFVIGNPKQASKYPKQAKPIPKGKEKNHNMAN